jgi:transcriptional regulator
MFVPKKFAVGDLVALDALIARDAFVTLVSTIEGAPFATHLPVLYARTGDRVKLRGHWAKANPQWREIDLQTALVIVHGPHAYVSPSWYPDPTVSVPTWNYAVAHLYGRAQVDHDSESLGMLVAELAEKHETSVGSGWRFPDAAPGTVRELAGIVGFEFVADRVEIKHKLNQHHPAGNVEGAVIGLRAMQQPQSTEIADMMEAALFARADDVRS